MCVQSVSKRVLSLCEQVDPPSHVANTEDAQPAGERTFAPQVGDEENDEYISGGDPEAKDNEAFLAKHFAYSNAEDGAYPAYQGDNQKNDVHHGTSQATSS